MVLTDRTILITGADGGIATAIIAELMTKNVKKIYATGLNLATLKSKFETFGDKIVPLELDITNTDSIRACAQKCGDTDLLINNAGVEFKVPFLEEKAGQAALFEMKVNYIGVIEMINHFLPHLLQQEQGGIVNILSIGSLAVVKRLGTYCASKTATHILTETIREELSEKGIKVMGVYMGYVNTAMTPEQTASPKAEPKDIAQAICQGIENDEDRIYPDPTTRTFVRENPINTLFFD